MEGYVINYFDVYKKKKIYNYIDEQGTYVITKLMKQVHTYEFI